MEPGLPTIMPCIDRTHYIQPSPYIRSTTCISNIYGTQTLVYFCEQYSFNRHLAALWCGVFNGVRAGCCYHTLHFSMLIYKPLFSLYVVSRISLNKINVYYFVFCSVRGGVCKFVKCGTLSLRFLHHLRTSVLGIDVCVH